MGRCPPLTQLHLLHLSLHNREQHLILKAWRHFPFCNRYFSLFSSSPKAKFSLWPSLCVLFVYKCPRKDKVNNTSKKFIPQTVSYLRNSNNWAEEHSTGEWTELPLLWYRKVAMRKNTAQREILDFWNLKSRTSSSRYTEHLTNTLWTPTSPA